MLENLLQLIVLFFVIIDPPLSFAVFSVATRGQSNKKKINIASVAISFALLISYTFLFFGGHILKLFSTNIDNFRVAGGIILAIYGTRMALGRTSAIIEKSHKNSVKAIAAIIATPLISGPATMTAIVVSTHDYGMFVTGIAVGIILALTGLLLFLSIWTIKWINETAIQVATTFMGLVTLSWGITFIRGGLGF